MGLFRRWFRRPADPQEPEHPCTAEEIDAAVLRILVRRLPNNIDENFAEWGSCSIAQVEGCRAEVAKLREWALTLEDRRVRCAYLKWLAVWDDGADKAVEELRTHKGRLASERRREQDIKEQNTIAECIAHLPNPRARSR